jgi:hypothetical protein
MVDRNSLLNDTETSLRVALDGRQSNLWTAFPAIVESVDFAAMTLEAQPAIQGVVNNPDGITTTVVNLPLLVDVPICFPSAGGFLLTLPIKAGDEVLIIIASRCIDAWWQNGGVQPPMEARMHDLSDGFALPGPRSQPKVVGGISTTGAQLRNDSGTTYIEIAANGKIKLVSPTSIDITGNLNVTGDVVAGTISLKTHTHPVTTAPGTTGAPT